MPTIETRPMIQTDIPMPTARSHRGKASKWEALFSGLKQIGVESFKVMPEGNQTLEQVENNARQAGMAFRQKHGKQLAFFYKIVYKNEALETDPEKDGNGVRVWRKEDREVMVVTAPTTVNEPVKEVVPPVDPTTSHLE